MTGNSGTGGGRFARGNFDRQSYERELAAFREVLDNAEVVGHPRREAELYELDRLVRKYPVETRRILQALEQQEE